MLASKDSSRSDVGAQQHRGLLLNFYTTTRAGVAGLSDGGGPLGFDITTALQVDHVMRAYDCDGIVETGCFLGDTTDYLARQYPDLPVRTCDSVGKHAAFTQQRLRGASNVTVLTGDSAVLLPQLLDGLRRPLVYLDAHWDARWPLREELMAIRCGVAVVDDFDIGHDRFGYDTYDATRCGPALISDVLPDLELLFVGNPYARYPFPCQQVGRRSGTAYIPRGLQADPLAVSGMYVRIPLQPAIVMPDWTVFDPRPTIENELVPGARR